MGAYRGYLFTLAACVAVEVGIYHVLAGLGANGEFAAAIEMIWLCAAVILTILIGGHFDHSEDPDDL